MITSLSDSSPPPLDVAETICCGAGGASAVVGTEPGPPWPAEGGGVRIGDASNVGSTAGGTLPVLVILLLLLLLELW